MDRQEQMERELEELKALVSELSEEVTVLRRELRAQKHPVEAFLSQRGLPVLAHGENARILLPPRATIQQRERLYHLLRRYSFRLFLRDLLQFPEGNDFNRLNRYCSLKTIRSYLENLSELGIAEFGGDRSYRLIPTHIVSFGPTLEWYVREILQREFLAPALFNVRLDQTRYGGDYDVIALLAGYLVYVEVKSSPPRGVEQPAVSAFLNRLEDLQPHLAVFLVDTELRMKDKIALLFAEALYHKPAAKNRERPVVRLIDEIFHVEHGIYLINSRKGIYSNLRVCFRDFLRSGGESSIRTDKEEK